MEEIINSVMQSPENTNPNVLRSQLQNIGSGSGSSACWTKTETEATLFEGSVTGRELQEGVYGVEPVLQAPISADTIFVEYNGDTYVLNRKVVTVEGTDATIYGDFDLETEEADFSNFPVVIISAEVKGAVATMLYMDSEGPNDIKITGGLETIITPTDDFKKAVNESISIEDIIEDDVLLVTATNGVLNKTMGEIQDAFLSGRPVLVDKSDSVSPVLTLMPVKDIGDGKQSKYQGTVICPEIGTIDDHDAYIPLRYSAQRATEDGARSAYPQIYTYL